MHNEYIDWVVKPQLQSNIDTFVNQIMYVMHQSFTHCPPPPRMTPGIPYWKYGHEKLTSISRPPKCHCPPPPLYNDKFLGGILTMYICIIAEIHLTTVALWGNSRRATSPISSDHPCRRGGVQITVGDSCEDEVTLRWSMSV